MPSITTSKQNEPHIVVLGGGFAGINFCRSYKAGRGRITLVDRTNHHLFQPLLYQVATTGLSASDIAAPVRAIFRSRRDITVLMDEVKSINLTQRQVTLQNQTLNYDYLVLAMGGQTNFFGHDNWAKHAFDLKTLDDAIHMRVHLLSAFEQAENCQDENQRRKLMTTVVVGGGPTGVELAGAVAELAHKTLKKDFRRIDTTQAKIILVEAGDRLLKMYPPSLSQKAKKQLEQLNVQVRLNTPVSDIKPDKIVFADGSEIATCNVLWGAGVKAHPITSMLGGANVELDKAGRIKVNKDLSIPGFPDVFALGDLASVFQDDGSPVPGIAPAAIQMGKHAAKIIGREVKNLSSDVDQSTRASFKYFDKGTMATIGRRRAVAQIGHLKCSGLLAWLSWLCIHLIFLVGFRSRLFVLASWCYSYFTFRTGARVIGAEEEKEVKQ